MELAWRLATWGLCAAPVSAHILRRHITEDGSKGYGCVSVCVVPGRNDVGIQVAPARCVGMYCYENGKLKYLKFEKDHPSKDLIVQYEQNKVVRVIKKKLLRE